MSQIRSAPCMYSWCFDHIQWKATFLLFEREKLKIMKKWMSDSFIFYYLYIYSNKTLRSKDYQHLAIEKTVHIIVWCNVRERNREGKTFWDQTLFRWTDLDFHEGPRLREGEEHVLGMSRRWGGWLHDVLQPEDHHQEHHDAPHAPCARGLLWASRRDQVLMVTS